MDKNTRLASIDALRGFDMLFIIGFASLLTAVCKLLPEGGDSWLAVQMTHVEWDGLRHHDTIFPLFLFIAGISFPFSFANQQKKGASMGRIYARIFRRGLVLVLFGLICNGLFKFDFEHLRFASVLGRIGLAWMFAALIFINAKPAVRAAICAVILIGYWLLCGITAPDAPTGAGPLSQDGCLVGYIDRCVMPGHLYNGNFDPEGILSTLPAIVTALLGMFTGEFVRIPDRKISGGLKTLCMIGAAAVMLGIGLFWDQWFPINKKLWSSSFVLAVGAYSLAMFALFYLVIDVLGLRKWAFPLRVIGVNSITIFMAPRIISFSHARDFFLSGVIGCVPEPVGKVISLAGFLLLEWLFLYFLYRKKIFLKV